MYWQYHIKKQFKLAVQIIQLAHLFVVGPSPVISAGPQQPCFYHHDSHLFLKDFILHRIPSSLTGGSSVVGRPNSPHPVRPLTPCCISAGPQQPCFYHHGSHLFLKDFILHGIPSSITGGWSVVGRPNSPHLVCPLTPCWNNLSINKINYVLTISH